MSKIKTKSKIFQTRNGELAFIGREMVNFNHDKNKKKQFVSIVREYAFRDVENDVLDENEEPTGEKYIVREILEEIQTKAHTVSFENTNDVFSAIGDDILASGNFVEQFNTLQRKALLFDTKPHKLYNIDASEWEEDLIEIKTEINV